MSRIKIAFRVSLLGFTFLAALYASDSIQNWQIRRNLQYVHPGTTESELKALLGTPTCMTYSDIAPGQYWSFGKDSFAESPDFCGSVALIEMSGPPIKVVQVRQW
jgi:hypothetical protein